MEKPKPNLENVSTHEFMQWTYKNFLREEFVFLFGIYCSEPSGMAPNTGNVLKSNGECPDTSVDSKNQKPGTYVTKILNLMDSRLNYVDDSKECLKASYNYVGDQITKNFMIYTPKSISTKENCMKSIANVSSNNTDALKSNVTFKTTDSLENCSNNSSHKTSNTSFDEKKQSDIISVNELKQDDIKAVKTSGDLPVCQSDIEKNVFQETESASHNSSTNTIFHDSSEKKQSNIISVNNLKEDDKAVKTLNDLTVSLSDIENNIKETEKEINLENIEDNLNLETSSSIAENYSTSFNKKSNKTLNNETSTTHLGNSLNRKRSKSKIDSQHVILKKKKLERSSVNDSEMNTSDSAMINSDHAVVSKYKIINNCARNSKGETQLHLLCAKGKLDQIISILLTGFNPNVKDNAGWTPLHEAVKFGDLSIVKLLIEFGAFLNVPGFDYESPLLTAIQYERFDVAKLLLQKGADSKCINIYGIDAQCLNKNMWSKLSQFENPCISENENLPYELDEICIYLHNVSLNSSIVNKFCQNFKVKSVTKAVFKKQLKNITHIVVPVNENNACDANFECLLGIANGICIVNQNWIVESLEFGLLKQSLNYEVSGTTSFVDTNGPKKSRLNKQKLLPKLFDGINIHINGSITGNNFTVEQLKEIVLELGATILKRVPDPENCFSNVIPYHCQYNEQMRHVSTIILYCEDSRRLIKYNMSHVKTFSVPWFLEVVQKFNIA